MSDLDSICDWFINLLNGPIGMLLKCKFESISKRIQIRNDLTVINAIEIFLLFFNIFKILCEGMKYL